MENYSLVNNGIVGNELRDFVPEMGSPGMIGSRTPGGGL